MGFLDKVKAFAGGKGMAKVTITVIERQPAETATFPVTDSVLKGTMVIEAQQPCTVLATKYEVWLYIAQDASDTIGSPNLIVTEKDPDPKMSYHESVKVPPWDMTPGQTIEKPWMVSDVDLAKVLAKAGYGDPNAAVNDPRVRLVVKCIADVKGSPFDPSAEVTVRLVPSA
jgi:hypothetical protein